MNAYKLIFESCLFQFDWGQEDPENAVVEPDQFQLPVNTINSGNLMDFEKCIARYCNWHQTTCQLEQSTNQQLLNSPAGAAFRLEALNAIENRLMEQDQDHPVLLLYAAECRFHTQQDRIC